MNPNEPINTNTNEATELLAPTSMAGLSFVNPNDIPDLDAAEAGSSLEMKYYEFVNPGQAVRAIYSGITKINKRKEDGTMEQLDAIVFQNREGVFLNGGDNIVSQLRNVPPGTPIQITFDGKEATKSGYRVNKFTVRLLNVSGFVTKTTPRAITTTPVVLSKKAQLLEAHKALWNQAHNMGLLVEENVKQWAVVAEDTLETLKGKIALLDGAVNFPE
jgi:hypothetical protein